jgi:ankyrin repeat protein
MDQVVRALKLVAESRTDTRRAAACVELAICYACDFVECGPGENKPVSDSASLRYLIRAAELGDDWAKAITYRVSLAINQPITPFCPVKSWLFDAGIKGSRIALASLKQLDSQLHGQALRSYRTTLCGNSQAHFSSLPPSSDLPLGTIINNRKDTLIHWISSTGQSEKLITAPQIPLDVINSQNSQGDTPLLCAARAGHHHVLMKLIGLGADGSIRNFVGENALHFLGNLDADQVSEAAQMLISAGAQVEAEAKSYTGNTYLETRPVGKGCPKLRAVMLDQPHVLRVLLQLETHSRLLNSQSQKHTSASTQRLMIAWALRLRYILVLQVLEEYFHGSRPFTDIRRIRIWCSGRRYSLLELCILGSVSSNQSTGFDLPDRFWRYINYGGDQWRHLETSLCFLLDRQNEHDTPDGPHNSASDGLFFAITESNRDAAKCIISTRSLNLQVNFASDANLTEIRGHILRPDQKQLRAISDYSYLESRRDSPFVKSMNFLDKANWEAYGSEDIDAYVSPRTKGRRSPSHTQRHCIQGGETEPERYEEDDLEAAIDPLARWSSGMERTRNLGSNNQENYVRPASDVQPRGIVDAILLAIVHDRRGIFYDLVIGLGCSTLQPSHANSCYVFMGKKYDRIERKLRRENRCSDLRDFFPERAAQYLIMSKKLSKGDYFEFDGNFRCSLLYMTAIARSKHRDIHLA